jgi:Myosin-like coiled-coil protein.
MSKKIKDIDNENVQLQRKAEKSDVSIVEMMEEVKANLAML